jgi:stalled ribosome alternative rescue factor ArfA
MVRPPTRKPGVKRSKRNPVAERLAEPRYRPRKETPKKGKGSYRRRRMRPEDDT